MKEEIAYRFAATAVEGVSLKQAKEIIDTYKVAIATCATCNNQGGGRGGGVTCLTCHTDAGDKFPKGDNRMAKWVCLHHENQIVCQAIIDGKTSPGDLSHDECGPEVNLPIPLGHFRKGVS